MLEVGTHGPDFVLSCHDHGMTRLSQLQAKNDYVVVFFFLVAGSPGCTRQVNGFRDLYGEFQKRRVGIVGISPDSVSALAQFVKDNNIPFDLCSDQDHAVATQWGTWSERGQMRSTFILNQKGTICHIFPRANVYTHAQDVLQVIDAQIAKDGGALPAQIEAEPKPAPPPPAPPSPAAAAPAPLQSPTSAPGVSAGDILCAFARTSLQLLIQHLEGGGQLPSDIAELAGRVALLRYR
ncbi:MAG: peroxiredoxin [Myxococcales bacterium]|nr:peroxiredoxin [Myxococcota bacterium]MDW8283188.1 peroxiredoxin [Myxococcales bacterium]